MDGDLAPYRGRLFALAYRMLGSAADAEDVLQDAWLRWQATPGVEQPEAWLVTTVSRLCLDRLKSAPRRREVYVGPWLPEPVATAPDDVDPESISVAVLLLLERLSPVQRAAFVLQRVFDYSPREIAAVLHVSEDLVRQSLHRAADYLARDRPRFAPSKAQHAALLAAFAQACQAGDVGAIEALLAADARAWTDGGGRVRAALNVVDGATAVARFLAGVSRKFPVSGEPELRELNGLPSVVVWDGARASVVLGIETDGERVWAVHVVSNPDKLGRLGR